MRIDNTLSKFLSNISPCVEEKNYFPLDFRFWVDSRITFLLKKVV